MKGDLQVIALVAAFFLGFLNSSLSDSSLEVLRHIEIGTMVAALAAAFFGARYAFFLENEKEKKRERALRVEGGNHSLFLLVRTLEYFQCIKREYKDEEKDPHRDLLIRPFIGVTGFELKFDFRDLFFLFESDNSHILNKLGAFQAEVASTLDVVTQRSEIHKTYAQPANERLFQAKGLVWDPKEVKKLMGPNQSTNLRQATDEMIKGVDSVIEGALTLSDELRESLSRYYPDQPFIRYLPNKAFNSDAGKAGAG